METNAYYDGYLSNAQDTLGNMMDYAVNTCGIKPEEIFIMFLTSQAAKQFERGNPRYVAGLSGAELANEVVQQITGKELTEPESFYLDKSPEYWCGWILAYYQWRTGRSFKRIHRIISIEEVLCMYPTHHEADVQRFVDTVNYIYSKKHTKTYLQQLRENMSMDIKELSAETGIDERVISELEGDFARIRSTEAIIVFRLSQVLGCRMDELMEI